MSKQSWVQKCTYALIMVGVISIIIIPLIKLGLWGSAQLSPDKRPDFIAKLVGTGTTAIGGVVLFLNFRNAQNNTRLAEKRIDAEVARNSTEVQLANSRLLAERFSKAIEQLGTNQVTVRLGGIYSLEKLLQDSPQDYYWTVIEVLTSLIRSDSSALPLSVEQTELLSIPIDIQAALAVIGRRNITEEKINQRINLSNANLTAAQFSENSVFKDVLFEGTCFNKAYLSNVDLSYSVLNRAKLNSVNSLDENKPIRVAKFFATQLMQSELISSQLSRADFTNANLQKANLSSSNLYESIFTGAKLIGASLDNANLSRANFSGANLSGASLVNADLLGANFTDADISEEQLKQARNYERALRQIGSSVD